MSDYLHGEIAMTEAEAAASTVRGWAWVGVAWLLVVASGACAAAGSHAASVVLAAWATGPLLLAVRWLRAAELDREQVRWMRGQSWTGHTLSDYSAVTSERGRHFEATCGCGTVIRHRWLWRVWEAHGDHLRNVRFLSRKRHPSGGGA